MTAESSASTDLDVLYKCEPEFWKNKLSKPMRMIAGYVVALVRLLFCNIIHNSFLRFFFYNTALCIKFHRHRLVKFFNSSTMFILHQVHCVSVIGLRRYPRSIHTRTFKRMVLLSLLLYLLFRFSL